MHETHLGRGPGLQAVLISGVLCCVIRLASAVPVALALLMGGGFGLSGMWFWLRVDSELCPPFYAAECQLCAAHCSRAFWHPLCLSSSWGLGRGWQQADKSAVTKAPSEVASASGNGAQ